MHALHALIGREHDLADVARELRATVRSLGASAVGGFQVTCADESEHECSHAFEQGFALELLPRLFHGERVPFRIVNPGGRYEWGSVCIAERHFATSQARGGFLAMVVKINGHTAVRRTGADGMHFGSMERYGSPSYYCGAIHGLFEGSDLPFVEDLRRDLSCQDLDRVAMLEALAAKSDGREMLFGALAAARLQARKCVIDIQDHEAAAPTLWIVMHGVSLNKPGHDGEVVGGMYVLDHRGPERRERYIGLGDDPSAYRLERASRRLGVSDPHLTREREVRDHRALAGQRLGGLEAAARTIGASSRQLLEQLHAQHRTSKGISPALLRLVLGAVGSAAPLAGALLLVAEGAADMHHAWILERAGSEEERERMARRLLRSVDERLDRLPPAVGDRVARALLRDLHGGEAEAR